MTAVARKGVGALLIAYVILFLLIAAVLGVVLLGRDKNEAVVSLRPAPAAPAQSISNAAPAPVPLPVPKPEPAPAAAPAPPSPSSPSPSLLPPATPSPAASEPPKPAEPAQAAPSPPPPDKPEPSVAAARPTLYPPPPPEKPKPPAKNAAATPSDAPAQGRALMPAALLETGPHGPLPRIAPDGRLPWIINNSRFDHGTRQPRLGIILTGLGLNAQATEDAIIRLPPEVTLAFVPYAENLPRWVQLARQFGHEVLISLPLDSENAAAAGLGPRMMSASATPQENLDRLRWILSRASGYVGVVTWEGDKFLANARQAVPVLQELALRGLLVVDSRQARSNVVQQHADEFGLPFAKSRGFLDSEEGVAALDRNLQQLEAITQRAGFGVAMAVAFPDTVKRLVDWSKTVGQRGFVLAPITGVSECKELCQQRVARHAAAVSPARR